VEGNYSSKRHLEVIQRGGAAISSHSRRKFCWYWTCRRKGCREENIVRTTEAECRDISRFQICPAETTSSATGINMLWPSGGAVVRCFLDAMISQGDESVARESFTCCAISIDCAINRLRLGGTRKLQPTSQHVATTVARRIGHPGDRKGTGRWTCTCESVVSRQPRTSRNSPKMRYK
jgi:hypothetical protein